MNSEWVRKDSVKSKLVNIHGPCRKLRRSGRGDRD